MKGEDVRKARVRAGLTQTELAQKLAISQGYLSGIETGARGIRPSVLRALYEALGEHLEEPRLIETSEPAFVGWTPNPPALALPLRLRKWERLQVSGDAFGCLPLFGGAVLVVAIDVAGHGAEAAGPANFLIGWLRGWSSGLATTPHIESCVDALAAGLSSAGTDASWFLALLVAVGSHEVEYTAKSYGFPSPLLILDDADLTFESTGTKRALRHEVLRPPWKLVIASDGLLERLGGGEEGKGKRVLLRWQSSRTREQPLEERLNPGGPLFDDETLLIVEWFKWDLDLEFDIVRDADRHRVQDEIERWLGKRYEGAESQRIENALCEVLDNAHEHAYALGTGKVHVRVRDEGNRIRIVVEDRGTWRGQTFAEGAGFKVIRSVADEVDFWRVYPHGLKISLTRVKPENSR